MITATETRHGGENYEVTISEGESLRDALATIRKAGRSAFGNIGGMEVTLSDRSFLCVELQEAHERGARLMNSQRIVRKEFDSEYGRDRIVRVYAW
jgi:hypothetical protein